MTSLIINLLEAIKNCHDKNKEYIDAIRVFNNIIKIKKKVIDFDLDEFRYNDLYLEIYNFNIAYIKNKNKFVDLKFIKSTINLITIIIHELGINKNFSTTAKSFWTEYDDIINIYDISYICSDFDSDSDSDFDFDSVILN